MKSKKGGLSTSVIKTIALIIMFIDHFAAGVVVRMPNLHDHLAVYQWMRHIGRISFPIYCFFIVEGFYKTRDRKRYARRLAACALISEVPFDLAIYGKVFYPWHQNVFVTLLVGLFAIWALESVRNIKEMSKGVKIVTSLCTGVGFALLAEVLFTDYGSFGVLCIIMMYVVRKLTEDKIKFWAPVVLTAGIVVLTILSYTEIWALLGLPLMFFYKGKKGWNAKWFFYLFYPVHLLVIAVIALCLGVQRWGLF